MKYRVGDVLLFGDEWILVLNEPDPQVHPNVTIGDEDLFLGGYDPNTDPNSTYPVLFNIFDIKRKVEENET